ncbi:hypothetical protein CL622_06950 [archaeon]|nr:hypothetical protein [archaeon]|tara:strand:+ start:312 stop:581 length:270 start_codon:yes stop_codon:yes gene_type:complete
MQRRTSFEIINDILFLMQRKGGKLKPTHILYGGNLSYDRLKKYMEQLEKRKLVEVTFEKEKKFYLLTDRGYEYVNEARKLKQFTEAFGI